MRVISQDRNIDIPYNLCLVHMLKAYDCYKVVATLISSHHTLATYSSEEKTIKAMEILREEYQKYSKVFQFPQDEEIEV